MVDPDARVQLTESLNKRILIVDDSNVIRSQLNSILTNLGFEVLACEEGFDALAKVAEFNPAMVFTDISMPKVDGYETVALLRASEQFSEIPIIMLSSKSGVFDVAKGRLLGCNDYLIKPVSQKGVEDIIDKFLPKVH